MSLIRALLDWPRPAEASANPWTNPGWWAGGLGETVAGVSVGPDTALKISTVYACVGLLSETIASLPLVVYRYLENEAGRERARNHPLYEVLHDQPNDNQTAVDFVQMMQAHALLRGSGYAQIRPGPRGFADTLWPIHPDRVEKQLLSNGRIRYRVQDEQGSQRTLNSSDVFEVGGLSLDGWNTVSVVSYARDSFGMNLAAERYGARFFRNDSKPSGILTTEGRLSKGAAGRLKSDWLAMHSGTNQHQVAVLEEGLKWQSVAVTPEEAQFLETRVFEAEDVCRWFRVPPHMVGLTSKATSWGTGIEEMTIGFLTYTLRPWLTRWRQAIRRDLILAPGSYFVDFVVEELLRGDIETRYNAYAIARQWGWMSVNDVRRKENENPIPGGDVYLQPMNMVDAGWEGPPGKKGRRQGVSVWFRNPEQAASSEDLGMTGGRVASHYRLLAEEAAGRVVRKEMAAMGRVAGLFGSDKVGWDTAVLDFYGDHAGLVAQTMRISLEQAAGYVAQQQRELLAAGPDIMMDWEIRRVNDLAEMAIGIKDGNNE